LENSKTDSGSSTYSKQSDRSRNCRRVRELFIGAAITSTLIYSSVL